MPPKRSDRLKHLLSQARRTADQTQQSFLKAEDAGFNIADREAKRAQPVPQQGGGR